MKLRSEAVRDNFVTVTLPLSFNLKSRNVNLKTKNIIVNGLHKIGISLEILIFLQRHGRGKGRSQFY